MEHKILINNNEKEDSSNKKVNDNQKFISVTKSFENTNLTKDFDTLEKEVNNYLKRLKKNQKNDKEIISNKFFITKENLDNKAFEKLDRETLLNYYLVSYNQFKETNKKLFRKISQKKLKKNKKMIKKENEEMIKLWRIRQIGKNKKNKSQENNLEIQGKIRKRLINYFTNEKNIFKEDSFKEIKDKMLKEEKEKLKIIESKKNLNKNILTSKKYLFNSFYPFLFMSKEKKKKLLKID